MKGATGADKGGLVDPDAVARLDGVEMVDVGADDLAEGCLRGVDLGDEHIVIARTEGRLCAIGGVCTHQVAFLEDGYLGNGMIHCPRHGAAFDLETGAAMSAPAVMPVPVFHVRVAAGRVLVSRRPRQVPLSALLTVSPTSSPSSIDEDDDEDDFLPGDDD